MGFFFKSLVAGFFLVAMEAGAQASRLPNIAVVDFAGDRLVTAEQLNFIAGILATELIKTKKFQVLERSRMDAILREHGFQQSGACNSNECKVQVGQLLGVEFLVMGNLVRFGPTYMMRVDYLDVATGKIKASVNLQAKGELHEVVNGLCSQAAQELITGLYYQNDGNNQIQTSFGQTISNVPVVVPPKRLKLSAKRKLALGVLFGSLAVGGFGVFYDLQLKSSSKDYHKALADANYQQTRIAFDDAEVAQSNRNISYGISVGTLVVGALLWFWSEGEK